MTDVNWWRHDLGWGLREARTLDAPRGLTSLARGTQSLAAVFIIICVFPSPRPLPCSINNYLYKEGGGDGNTKIIIKTVASDCDVESRPRRDVCHIPADTLRNNDVVVITSKRRHFDVVIITSCIRGVTHEHAHSMRPCRATSLCKILITYVTIVRLIEYACQRGQNPMVMELHDYLWSSIIILGTPWFDLWSSIVRFMELHKSNYGAPIPNTIHKYNCGSLKICSGKWGDTVSKLFLKITHLYVAVLCPLHWLSTSNPSDWLDGPSIIIVTSSNGNIFRVILAICVGNSPVTGEFPAQRPVTRGFGVFFDLRLNKRLSKQSWGWWFETPSRPLWRHINVEAYRRPTSQDERATDRACFL